jgi:hypothetical protein
MMSFAETNAVIRVVSQTGKIGPFVYMMGMYSFFAITVGPLAFVFISFFYI